MTRKLKILEVDVETPVCRYAKSKNVMHEKFTSPAKRSVPDRLFTLEGGSMFFIEFKAPNKTATTQQKRDHKKRRAKGVRVYVCDDVIVGKQIIDFEVAFFAS